MKLQNTPPKGTADWFPEEFKVRKYIFDTWREVCQKYGFEEYLGPLVESVEIWKAKSGEDVGGSELTQITNREGVVDGLALRPEMTPTVTRMVSRIWKEVDKPVKWFSIANFYRNERPQRGRNREFWQLNVDIFGDESTSSEIELLTMSIDLMRGFEATPEMYQLHLNHRGLIEAFFSEVLQITDEHLRTSLMRLLDKYEKLPREIFEKNCQDIGVEKVEEIHTFLSVKTIGEIGEKFSALEKTAAFQELKKVFNGLNELGYEKEIGFSGSLIRGFDYYDGIIFEMFDKNPKNPRALFGGGRYNGLASIFGVKDAIPAVGFAPGDEPMRLFLEGHNLLEMLTNTQEKKYYFPLLEEKYFLQNQKIASMLREKGNRVRADFSVRKLAKAFKYANKNNFSHTVIFGSQEAEKNIFVIKNMQTGEQKEYTI